MSDKTKYYMAVLIGTTLGSMIPSIWGAGMFSFSSVLLGGLGGVIAVVLVYKSL